MTPEDAAQLGQLLLGQRLLALGVVVEGAPVVGLLPYAVSEDRRALYVQASSLARHTRGLVAGAPWSGLDPRARRAHDGSAAGSEASARGCRRAARADSTRVPGRHARASWQRFPQAAATLQLSDFGLYRLELHGGRMVLGFGQALNLSRGHFLDIASA